jgi:hypothetical protein
VDRWPACQFAPADRVDEADTFPTGACATFHETRSMPDAILPRPVVPAAALALLLPLLLAACGEQHARPGQAGPPGSADQAGHPSNEDPRPTLTPDLLDAYVRGMEEEIALMDASGSHFIPLSKYDEQGLQVAATAALPLPEYRGLRQKVNDVLYAHMMHERYAGADGQARLDRLEPHKREHALEVLANEPFATLSAAERSAVQARLDTLRDTYDRYMRIAAIAD